MHLYLITITCLGQRQNSRQRLDRIICTQTRLGQIFQSAGSLHRGVFGITARILCRFGELSHLSSRTVCSCFHPAHGSFKISRTLNATNKGFDTEVPRHRHTDRLDSALKTTQYSRGIVLGINDNLNGLEGHGVSA